MSEFVVLALASAPLDWWHRVDGDSSALSRGRMG